MQQKKREDSSSLMFYNVLQKNKITKRLQNTPATTKKRTKKIWKKLEFQYQRFVINTTETSSKVKSDRNCVEKKSREINQNTKPETKICSFCKQLGHAHHLPRSNSDEAT